jgi:dTDP-4-amino-4,6-dideoxygalactose transaminase
MTPGQARAGIAQLARVDSDADIRIRNAEMYRRGLSGIPGLVLPPDPEPYQHVYVYFPVQVERRTEFVKWMMRHNRDIAAQHLRNCADLPSFAEFAGDCPNARAVAAGTVLLPTYPRYPAAEIERNIEVIQTYFHR